MSSGVKASSDCVTAYNDLKLAHKYKYIIYSLNKDYSEIIIEHTATPDGRSNEDAFNEFREKLPSDDGRYAVFDFEFEKADGSGKRNKICFVSWSPDNAKVRPKMTYASSKDGLRKALVGLQVELQANDIADIDYETVLKRCERLL